MTIKGEGRSESLWFSQPNCLTISWPNTLMAQQQTPANHWHQRQRHLYHRHHYATNKTKQQQPENNCLIVAVSCHNCLGSLISNCVPKKQKTKEAKQKTIKTSSRVIKTELKTHQKEDTTIVCAREKKRERKTRNKLLFSYPFSVSHNERCTVCCFDYGCHL